MTRLDENVEMCRRVAASGGWAVRGMSLPHPHLVKATCNAVGGKLDKAPFFGPRIAFGEEFIAAARAIGEEAQP